MHTGIYFGFAQVLPRKGSEHTLSEEDRKVHPMVMSLGWNPFYKNERMSAVSLKIVTLPACVELLFLGDPHHA